MKQRFAISYISINHVFVFCLAKGAPSPKASLPPPAPGMNQTLHLLLTIISLNTLLSKKKKMKY